jgi:DNA (cytosine-5)-methyltransferase 1
MGKGINTTCDEGQTMIAHSLRADGFDASKDGTGRGTPLIAFDTTQITSAANYSVPKAGDPCHPLASTAHPPAIAGTLAASGAGTDRPAGQSNELDFCLPMGMQVRRLTPRECERLQGFPDEYTQIPYRGKPAADGPRYKALGNSMAVPVMHWIGQRIQMVEDL